MGIRGKLITYRYYLSIDGVEVKEDNQIRRQIQRITTEKRRHGLSSLKIFITDPNMSWRKYFVKDKAVKVVFIGYNFDLSCHDKYEGYVAEISPATNGSLSDIEILCLNVPPSMNNASKKSRVFKKMSRRQVITKLAKEKKIKLYIEKSTEMDAKEDEIQWGINTSLSEFFIQTAEEVGYRASPISLTEWWFTPMLPKDAKYETKLTNKGQNATLLNFQPTFSRYAYEDTESKQTKGDQTKKKIDPKTKKIDTVKKDKKPDNNPKDKGGKGKGSKDDNYYYDPKSGKWIPVK